MTPQLKSQQIAEGLQKYVEESDAEQAIILFKNGDDMGCMVHGSPEFLMAAYQMMQEKVMLPLMKTIAQKILDKDEDDGENDPSATKMAEAVKKVMEAPADEPLDPESEGFKLFASIQPLSDKSN